MKNFSLDNSRLTAYDSTTGRDHSYIVFISERQFKILENWWMPQVLLNHLYTPLENKSVRTSGSCMRPLCQIPGEEQLPVGHVTSKQDDSDSCCGRRLQHHSYIHRMNCEILTMSCCNLHGWNPVIKVRAAEFEHCAAAAERLCGLKHIDLISEETTADKRKHWVLINNSEVCWVCTGC